MRTINMYCVWKTGEFCKPYQETEFNKLLDTQEPYMLICETTHKSIVLNWLGDHKTEQFLEESKLTLDFYKS